jgi:DNA-binding MarR family transcriptional regulator
MRNLRPLTSSGRFSWSLSLDAVVPVAETQQATIAHRRQQRLALRAGLEVIDRLDVREHEREVEDLQFLGVAVELRQRRRDQLHVAEQQRLELLGVAEKLRAGEDLHLHLARQLLLGEFLELERPLAFGRVLRHDMAELDDNRCLRQAGCRQRERKRPRKHRREYLHEVSFRMFSLSARDETKCRARSPAIAAAARATTYIALRYILRYSCIIAYIVVRCNTMGNEVESVAHKVSARSGGAEGQSGARTRRRKARRAAPSGEVLLGPLHPSEYDKLAAFRYALRSFLRFSEAATGRAGLTPQHYQAMLVLRNGADVTINELADELLIRHNSSVGLVDRLVTRRLVRRTRSLTDRRVVHLLLTSRGRKVLSTLASMHRHQLRQAGPELARLLSVFARAPVTYSAETAMESDGTD